MRPSSRFPWWLFSALSLCTCQATPAGDSGLAAADAAGVIEDLALTLEQSEVIGTVFTARWQGEDVDSARLELTNDAGEARSFAVDTSDGPEHVTPILGLKPESTWQVQLVATIADQQHVSPVQSLTAGPVPAALPALTVERLDPDHSHRGYYVTAVVGSATAVIFDSDGDYVWWYHLDGVEQLGRVRLSRDGQGVFMASVNLDGKADTDIVFVPFDGSTEVHLSTPDRHHDFVELQDGSLVYTAFHATDVGELVVAGDRLMERSADGNTRVIYDVTDHHTPVPGSSSGGTRWPHANAVDSVDDDGAFLVSFMYMDGIARIDRDSGAEDWFLGGSDSDFHDADGQSDFFDAQHGMQLMGDAILVFDNARQAHDSRAVELTLDSAAMRAEEAWSYHADPAIDTPVMGDVHRFDDGNTLVTFSYNGVIEEVDAAGTPTWRLSTGLGGALSWLDFVAELPSP